MLFHFPSPCSLLKRQKTIFFLHLYRRCCILSKSMKQVCWRRNKGERGKKKRTTWELSNKRSHMRKSPRETRMPPKRRAMTCAAMTTVTHAVIMNCRMTFHSQWKQLPLTHFSLRVVTELFHTYECTSEWGKRYCFVDYGPDAWHSVVCAELVAFWIAANDQGCLFSLALHCLSWR